MTDKIIRMHYFAEGRVQGVGFRYRSYYAAQRLGLTGYVRNLYDGRVELELQGREADISAFFDMVERGTFIEITNLDGRKMATDPAEASFQVREEDF